MATGMRRVPLCILTLVFELGATWSQILTFLVSVVSLPAAVVWMPLAATVTRLAAYRVTIDPAIDPAIDPVIRPVSGQ